MKNWITLILAVFIANSVLAQEYIIVNGVKKSPFEEVIKWFNDGEPLKFEDLDGFRTGRCFVPGNKVVFGSTLVFATKKTSDLGPGFPTPNKNSISKANIFLAKDPSRFDNEKTKKEATEDLTQHGEWNQITEVSNSPTLTWYYDMEPNGRIDYKFEVVENGDFYILKVTNLISQRISHKGYQGQYVKKGTVIYSCYYFNL